MFSSSQLNSVSNSFIKCALVSIPNIPTYPYHFLLILCLSILNSVGWFECCEISIHIIYKTFIYGNNDSHNTEIIPNIHTCMLDSSYSGENAKCIGIKFIRWNLWPFLCLWYWLPHIATELLSLANMLLIFNVHYCCCCFYLIEKYKEWKKVT